MKKRTTGRFAIIIFCLLYVAACKREDDEYALGNENGPGISSLIHYTAVSPTRVPADTVARATIAVTIDPGADSANRFVVFHTTSGRFDNNDTVITAAVNAYGAATVSIRNTVPERARVRAEVKGISIDTSVQFFAAVPAAMLLSADKYLAATTDSFVINAALFRAPGQGKVSDPVRVYFKIVPDSTQPHVLIIPDFADSRNGVATATVRNPFGLSGSFRLAAIVVSSIHPSDTIRQTIGLVIN